MAAIQKITSCLWFDDQAEEAVKFYTSVFKNSKTGMVNRYGKEGYEIHGKKEGTVMTIEFWLENQGFVALNGGPQFKFSEAISFIVNCDTQNEIDYYWEKLSEGADEDAGACGWLKDKFGLSWQIVPSKLNDMLTDSNSKRSQNVMKELLRMKKLDIDVLERAFSSTDGS